MTIKSVLIVDDSKTEQIFFSQLLTAEGYTTRAASDVQEAKKMIDEHRPDLILLDVVMPGHSGFHLTRTLSRNPEYASIPIVLCTSKDQETDRIWGLRQGAKAYLVKPVQKEELLSVIQSLCLLALVHD